MTSILKHLEIALTFLSRVLSPIEILRLGILLHVLTCSLHIHEQFFNVHLSGLALPKAIPSLAVFA